MMMLEGYQENTRFVHLAYFAIDCITGKIHRRKFALCDFLTISLEENFTVLEIGDIEIEVGGTFYLEDKLH